MTEPSLEDDMTELTDARFPRVDLVGKAANGFGGFLVAKQAGDAGGLFDPEYVRALIAKSTPDAGGGKEDQVTIQGSPGAIAALIHQKANLHAAVMKAAGAYGGDEHEVAIAKARYDVVLKEKYSADDRKKMAGSGAAMKDGSYPIGDEEDLKKAIHAVGRGGSSHNAIRKHIISRAKSLGKSSMIPDNWNSDGSTSDSVSKDALVQDGDQGQDGLDPTVPLAEPDDGDAPGNPTDPGSPAWEAIDAATAQKWTAILVRANNAIGLLADRELTEAATGADPDDADQAWDLQDAQCAIQFAIDTLASFAVGEQAEADLAVEAENISKAMAGFDPAPLEVLEGLSPVMKAGRVLSAANETALRTAAQSIEKVLSSLPQAPEAGESVSKEAAMAADDKGDKTDTTTGQEPVEKQGDAAAATEATSEDVTKAEDGDQAAATAGTGEVTKAEGEGEQPAASALGGTVLKAGVYDIAGDLIGLVDPARIATKVAKADDGDGGKPTQMAVFDQDGNLIGIVDPSDVTPVQGAAKKPAEGAAEAKPAEESKPEAGTAPDLTPAPAADAGTPASGQEDDEDKVTKADGAEGAESDESTTLTITKADLSSLVTGAVTAALDAQAPKDDVAKADVVAGLEQQIEELTGRLGTVEKQAAPPKVFTRGATPPPETLRGQDDAPAGQPRQVDVQKALARKHDLYTAPDAASQNEIAKGMQGDAITALTVRRQAVQTATGRP